MLYVHRAERATALSTGLARVLADLPADPFTPEVVAVPAKGIERWLVQRLSHRLGTSTGDDGVAANLLFPRPAELVADALAQAQGRSREDDPWAPGRLVWTLFEVVGVSAGEAWSAPLTRHLESSDIPGRRFAVAQRLARLFTAYAADRPQMLRSWVAGQDSDGADAAIADDLAWQPHLWRVLRAAIGEESPPERLPAACEALRADPKSCDLPPRLSLFGPTRLATAQLEVLAALGAHRDVHLWLPHPSPALWTNLASLGGAGRRRRRDDPAPTTRTPLLASLGRDVRELQQHLAATAPTHDDTHHPADPGRDANEPVTLLHRLQRSIADDELPKAPAVLDRQDRSVQVHACHGPARQVEVLREVLVGLLADDPTLEPRDVIVMCPDIEDYAALVSATFGLEGDPTAVDDKATADGHPGHRLRVRLADRSLRQTNPVLGLLAGLLDLTAARVTASELLDLAALPPVRHTFGFTDDDLERLHDWAGESGVRWGLDAAHRATYRLDSVPQNTWRTGLDRLLLGAAMAEDDLRWLGATLPLDDVDSSDIDLAGRLAELVARITVAVDRLAADQTPREWLAALLDVADLLATVPEAEAWQPAQVRRELAEVMADAGTYADRLTLTRGDVQTLLADRLAGRPTRANFRTGHLTVCSLVPMRSVPHRVVCLLGLDDGRFPRTTVVDGDDVLARDPLVGERDLRSEDRQVLLDAVMAAGEHLVLLYTGAHPRTNAVLPPAVPVGEVLDAIDTLAATADGRPARAQVVVRHPLQPFDPRNFEAGRLGPPRPFSFDRASLHGAERAAQPRTIVATIAATTVPATDADADVALDDLIAFLEHPAKAFLRQRLGITVLSDAEEPGDALPVALSPLEKWALGDRMLAAALRGLDPASVVTAESFRGTLPPDALGQGVLDEVMERVRPLVLAARQFTAVEATTVDVAVDVGSGRRLTGTVPDVRDRSVVRVTYSTLAAKHRLRAWLQLLALTAAHPDEDWTAVTIGRAGKGGRASMLGPVAAEEARSVLAEIVALRDKGLRRPLPLAAKTSATYAGSRRLGEDNAVAKAELDWSRGDFCERLEEAHRLVWGTAVELKVLRGEPAHTDPEESSRFGELALALWRPLFSHEQLVSL